MTCRHLKQLYETCQMHHLKLSSSDLIRIMCPECGVEEVCPSVLTAEYDARHLDAATIGASAPREELGEPAD
jgi:hypothetical protein